MRAWIDAVGLLGPGLPGWQASRPCLAGELPHPGGDFAMPAPDLLPAVERRRTGMLVKLMLAAGQDALGGSREAAATLPTVFASSGGDGEVINDICTTLAGEDRQVSPTRFHNSVHNAPAGYWSIATGSRAPSTSLSAYDWSFTAGLVEAAAQLATGRERLLLICADMPYPEPLRGVRPVSQPFAVALLFCAARGAASLAAVDVEIARPGATPDAMADAALERLRRDNPAARSLPLLARLASRQAGRLVFDYVAGGSLAITVAPC
ncbi:MAG TPA: beta-ketoacyl synthase chain length factor [Burkholderiales bacterium]|nr:beta-ketoacyl synthase chain length factor [Burkholderiales bacterium]